MPTETHRSILRLEDGGAVPTIDAVLRPNRSWPRSWFRRLMAVSLGVDLVWSACFAAHGLWPVALFLCPTPLWLWIAFRRSYASGRLRERLRTTDRDLTVERTFPGRPPLRWTFNRYWAHVVLERPDEDERRLLVGSHGRFVAVGDFLSPPERSELADTLKSALSR